MPRTKEKTKAAPMDCAECGMCVEPGNGYHSYAVCVLVEAVGSTDALVYAKQLMEDGAKGYKIGEPVTIVPLSGSTRGQE